MKLRVTVVLLALLVTVAMLSGCYNATPKASAIASPLLTSETAVATATTVRTTGKLPYQDVSLDTAARVNDLLSRMTLEDKAAQMVQAERGTAAEADVERLGLGSVLSGGGSVPADNSPVGWRKLMASYQQAAMKHGLGIPIIYGIDAVHGHNNVVGAVVFPHNIGLGAANDPALMREMGKAVAQELAATGIPWAFSPCVAVAQDPRWGRTYESFSDNAELVSRLALPFAQGLMEKGILPTAKHFLADGGTAWGTPQNSAYKLDQGDARIDEQTLRSIHLLPYKALIKAGVPTVMASFSSWNGLKMHANHYLLTDVLKGELGFKGFIVSDWNALEQLQPAAYDEKVALAVNSGVDMLMEPDRWKNAIAAIIKGVKDGKITQQRVDDAVARILAVKFDWGIFDDPLMAKIAPVPSTFGGREHRALAQELVSRSLVLLKNDKSALPFKQGSKLLVMGPAANDLGVQCGGWTLLWQGWSGDNGATSGTTILEGMKLCAARHGAEIITDTARAGEADAILLVVGERPYAEGEGDSKDLSLTGTKALQGNAQAMELAAKSGKPVVAVIVAGRQLMIAGELPGWDGAVMAYLPGSEGQGVALALFGEKGFTGKLPMPWYERVEDIGRTNAKLLFERGYGLVTAK